MNKIMKKMLEFIGGNREKFIFQHAKCGMLLAKKQKARIKRASLNLAPPTGLEPVTYGLTVRRSTD